MWVHARVRENFLEGASWSAAAECMALQASEAPPCEGWVTVGEIECRFLARNAADEANSPAVSSAPDMYVDAVTSRDSDSNDPAHHFLPVTEHWLKRAINTWRDDGFFAALEGLASNPEVSGGGVKMASVWTLAVKDWGQSALTQLAILPKVMTASEVITAFTSVRDWVRSPVRAMHLHPRLPYIAVARQDDSVDIRSLSQMEPSIVLRDKDQRMVTCLEWAPHSNCLLAVGAKVGVLLWNVDPSLPTSRFLTSWVRVETSPGHCPVSALSWSCHGNYIVTGSAADTNMVIWDVPMGVATRVRRTEGGGVNLVSVSPDGGRVFAASVGNVMRVWETEKWTCEKWTNSSGRCQAACWSPTGDFLLFALHGDPALYYLCFHGNNTAGCVRAVKCADLSPCPVGEGQETTLVGGSVQSMCWDPTGERIAIIFSAESPGHSLVAVFRTRVTSMLEVLPGGFIRGEDSDVPQLISFQHNCNQGALLATAWLSGRVSFTPLLHTQPHSSLSPPHPHHHQSHSQHHQSQLYSTQPL